MTRTEELIKAFLLQWGDTADNFDGKPTTDWTIHSSTLATDDDVTTFGDLVKRLQEERDANSWVFEVHGNGDPAGKFTSNALRFRTYEEAQGYGFNLGMRWFGFDESRIVPSQDKANHGWDEEKQCTFDLDKPEEGYQSLGRVEDARMVKRDV